MSQDNSSHVYVKCEDTRAFLLRNASWNNITNSIPKFTPCSPLRLKSNDPCKKSSGPNGRTDCRVDYISFDLLLLLVMRNDKGFPSEPNGVYCPEEREQSESASEVPFAQVEFLLVRNFRKVHDCLPRKRPVNNRNCSARSLTTARLGCSHREILQLPGHLKTGGNTLRNR